MSLMDLEVDRVYECDECDAQIAVTQKVSDDFLKTCPFCELDGLFMKHADCRLNTSIDLNQPTTLGSLAEKNTEEKIKRGEMKPAEAPTPWWRKGKKRNFDILKNPTKYIIEGKT